MLAVVIFRDRVTYGRRCVAALQAAGLDVVVADHGTTYPAALDWLAGLERSGIPVHRDGDAHAHVLWQRPWFRELAAAGPYIVTDPDVIPSEDCPPDWPDVLAQALKENPALERAGLSLRIDNLPEHNPGKADVIGWESQFWQRPALPGFYAAALDTTLSVHQPLTPATEGHATGRAVRSGFPYTADHLAWHEDPQNLPEDVAWFYAHLERRMCRCGAGISHWAPK
jgi:hypothetical protein